MALSYINNKEIKFGSSKPLNGVYTPGSPTREYEPLDSLGIYLNSGIPLSYGVENNRYMSMSDEFAATSQGNSYSFNQFFAAQMMLGFKLHDRFIACDTEHKIIGTEPLLHKAYLAEITEKTLDYFKIKIYGDKTRTFCIRMSSSEVPTSYVDLTNSFDENGLNLTQTDRLSFLSYYRFYPLTVRALSTRAEETLGVDYYLLPSAEGLKELSGDILSKFNAFISSDGSALTSLGNTAFAYAGDIDYVPNYRDEAMSTEIGTVREDLNQLKGDLANYVKLNFSFDYADFIIGNLSGSGTLLTNTKRLVSVENGKPKIYSFSYPLKVVCQNGYKIRCTKLADDGTVAEVFEAVEYEFLANEKFKLCIRLIDETSAPDLTESDIPNIVNSVILYTPIQKQLDELNTELNENINQLNDDINHLSNGYLNFRNAFAIGKVYDEFDTSIRYKISMLDIIQFDYDLTLRVNEGYHCLIIYYDDLDKFTHTSGWFNYPDTKTIPANSRFRITIEKYPTYELITDDEIAVYARQVFYSTKIENEIIEAKEAVKSRIPNNDLYHIICKDKYLHHINVDYYDGLIIPSQSIFDIRRAKRLGFNIIELNTQITSDNVFYTFHGSSGNFGNAFTSLDGSDIENVQVSSVTSEYIQQNVRYKSKYDKYKTAPTTLKEALYECKINNLIPLVQHRDGVVEIVEQIMGKDNFLVGLYSADRGTITNAICFSWLTGDYNTIINKANQSKGAYVCGINPTNSMYADYTQEDWDTFVEKIHEAGYFVSTCYESKQQLQMFLKAGFDIIPSRYCINDIEHGNMCNLESDLTFEDFNTNGTVSNGVLNLSAEQTLTPKETMENVFLGGGSMHIIFSGKIRVQLGQIDEVYESDGKKELWLSSFIQENSPTFTISAIENTDILEISYKASKM